MLRKCASGLLVFILLLILMPCISIAVPEDVSVSITLMPKSIPGPGKVGISVQVSCSEEAEYALQDIRLYKGSTLLAQANSLQPGRKTLLRSVMSVASNEVGTDITLYLQWTQNGEAQEKPLTLRVTKNSINPDITFTRTYQDIDLTNSDKADVVYTIVNSSEAYLTDITLEDFGRTIGSQEELYAGGSLGFTHSVKLGDNPKSKPTLTYTAYGKTFTRQLEEMPIVVRQPGAQLILESDKTSVKLGDTVSLRCTIKNTGSIDYSSLIVMDASTGEILYTATSLPVASTRSFSNSYTIPGDETFIYNAILQDEAGNTLEVTSAPVKVEVYTEDGSEYVTLTASADPDLLEAPGTARFVLSVSNSGSTPLSNVLLVNENGKVLSTISSLQMGTQRINYETDVEETQEFVFYAVLFSGTPNEKKIACTPVTITVSGPAPENSQMPIAAPSLPENPTEPLGGSRILGGIVLAIIIAVIVLTGLGILFVILLIRENNKKG